jgi:hypothetical protein
MVISRNKTTNVIKSKGSNSYYLIL